MADMNYLTTIENKIDSINTCAELEALKADLLAWEAEQITALQSSLTLLGGISAAPGSDLGEIVSWIQNAILVLTATITVVATTIASVTAQVARIIGKITTKMSTLGCG